MCLQVCTAVDDSYWRCVAAPTPPSLTQIDAYAQCGGINCAPALGSAAGDITCANAAWDNVVCADSTTSCQRVDDYFWQCLPTESTDDSNSAAEATTDDSSATQTDAGDSSSPQTADDNTAVATTQGYTDTHQSAINPGDVKFSTKAVSSSPVSAGNAPEAESAAASNQNDITTEPEDVASESSPADASSDDSSIEASGLGMLILPSSDDSIGDDSSSASADETGDLDRDLLTFAFNLECLEVRQYKYIPHTRYAYVCCSKEQCCHCYYQILRMQAPLATRSMTTCRHGCFALVVLIADGVLSISCLLVENHSKVCLLSTKWILSCAHVIQPL